MFFALYLLTFYFLWSNMFAIENVINFVLFTVQHVSGVTCSLLLSWNK